LRRPFGLFGMPRKYIRREYLRQARKTNAPPRYELIPAGRRPATSGGLEG
jgi:hypothetical protein